VELKAYSYLENAVVGEAAQVGPFARLRPQANLGRNTKVGNFVEVKNARLGEGSKVSHLSYVGDSEVGKDVNIGCGFIACNYDGVNKHTTTIEDGVFVGSGVQAIAPVTFGKDSYIATGSTINRDVPEGALAIARVKQENKEGYAARLKARMEATKKNKGK
jgi:bifunctional UDP-N-acetylglucosamine pyrophosphorylase/glucosamine-1-phosphate N-acetyltransferase